MSSRRSVLILLACSDSKHGLPARRHGMRRIVVVLPFLSIIGSDGESLSRGLGWDGSGYVANKAL